MKLILWPVSVVAACILTLAMHQPITVGFSRVMVKWWDRELRVLQAAEAKWKQEQHV